MGVNLALSVEVFFSSVPCSLGVPPHDTGGYSVITLGHFDILPKKPFFWKMAAEHKNRIHIILIKDTLKLIAYV